MVLMTHQRKIKQQNSRFVAVLIQCKQTHQHRIRTHQHLTGPNHQHRTFSRRTTVPTVFTILRRSGDLGSFKNGSSILVRSEKENHARTTANDEHE